MLMSSYRSRRVSVPPMMLLGVFLGVGLWLPAPSVAEDVMAVARPPQNTAAPEIPPVFAHNRPDAQALYQIIERHQQWYKENRRRVHRGLQFQMEMAMGRAGRAHLAGLDLSGTALWNEVRALAGRDDRDPDQHDVRGRWPRLNAANLSGANLSGADLSHFELMRADLSGADLSGADLTGANLKKANLRGANLSGANLTRAALMAADLRGATLDGVIIQGTMMRGARRGPWPVSTEGISVVDVPVAAATPE